MRLRTQFIITMFLFGIILVFMAVSAIITNRHVEKASKQEKIASSIAQGANELSYLANDYLIYRESQQLKRWQSSFASFSSQVASLRADRPDQQALVTNIRANQNRLKEVFDSVTSAVGGPSQKQSPAPDLAFLQVSWSRMAVQTQGLISDASRLSQLLRQQMDQLTDTKTWLMYVMVGLFGVFLLISYMLNYRRILKSLVTLQARTAVIGSGNLDFKIEEQKNDEIGDLSHAFNQMTTDLKAVTASKADLEREIVERKRAEAALRKSEKRYRSYIEVTEQLGWSTNADGEVVEDIPSWRKFTGQSEEEVKGWGWSKALHPDDLEHTARVWRNAVATRNKYEVEYRIRRYDGVYRHFLARGVPVFKEDGNILEWVGTCVDITERKQAEETLYENEWRLNRSQEIAHLGSWELDLVNNRLTWSDEVYRIFGLQPQEFGATYEDFLEAVHPDDRAAVDAAYSGSVREGRDTYEIEHQVVRKSTGETHIVHERCEHIRDASGRIIRSVGMVHDITERKRAEEALRQRTLELQQLTETLERRVQERTGELEVANEELKSQIDECARVETELKKSQSDLRQLSTALLNAQERERKLIAQEIHDSMGASLAATKFKVEAALNEMGDDNPQASAALKSVVPIVQGAIEEARRIQMSLRPSLLDDLGILMTINWFCRQFESTYSNIRIQKEIEIVEHEVPDPLKIVIYRVLQEALNNIAKHSKAPVVLLFLGKTAQSIQLVIRDRGQGFDLSEAQSRKGSTRGLGLDSMRERTELSGGSFSIESNKGKGTIVRAAWPLPTK